ncbi:MAG: prepilin-type N-terminal cleavage/methylation domain-containing protein [Pseudomonadota bacterium]
MLSKQNKVKNNRLVKGYTLIELAISLAIIAFLSTTALTIILQQNENNAYQETQEKLSVIDQALKDYVLVNNHLPCPTDITIDFGDSDFAVLDTVSFNFENDSLECEENNGGLVPVKTLNLDYDYLYDGWGNRFTYLVSRGLGSPDHFDDPNFQGDFTIIDLYGNQENNLTFDNGEQYGAAYVIVSSGANSTGGFDINGNQLPNAAGDELENYDSPSNNIFIQHPTTDAFDDIVYYKSKSDLVPIERKFAPVIIPITDCDNAALIINDEPPTDTSINPLGEFYSFDPAYETLAEDYYLAAKNLNLLCQNPPYDDVAPTSWVSDIDLTDIRDGDNSLGSAILGVSNANNQMASSVEIIGDINGDGFDDVAFSTDDSSGDGHIYISFGRNAAMPANNNMEEDILSQGVRGVKLIGANIGLISAGMSMTALGDVNDDQLDDFFISFPSNGSNNYGGYIFYGNNDINYWTSNITLDSTVGIFIEASNSTTTRTTIAAGPGDINGDGINDIVISALAAGTNLFYVYIIYGSPSLPTTIDIINPSSTNVVIQNFGNEEIGNSLAVGDVNGDGFDDIVIGAVGINLVDDPLTIGFDERNINSGGAYLLLGSDTLSISSPISTSSLTGTAGFQFIADTALADVNDIDGALAGTSVSVGDIDDDGFDDILIGAPNAHNDSIGAKSGEAYLILGDANITNYATGGILEAHELVSSTGTILRGNSNGDNTAISVDIIEDVNGDNKAEILIGAPDVNPNGVAYLIFGKESNYVWPEHYDLSSPLPTGEGTVIIGHDLNDEAGFSVSGNGDINFDGFGDFVIGAPSDDSSSTDVGAGYIIFGH